MLIRLLDITDTSHGVPYNILRVTQEQSAEEKETDRGRYRKEKCREMEERMRSIGKVCETKMTTEGWAQRESMKTTIL